jgi:hypothetical protein
MENETSKTRSLKVAFLLDPDGLRSLQTLLSKIKGAREYKVKFSDGSTIKYGDVDEITKLPNAGSKFIVSIIASAEDEWGHSIFLTMRGDPEPSVEYTVTGTQSDVFNLADSLDNWIASCTQWYSPAYASNLGVLLAFGFLFFPIFLASQVAKVFPPKGPDWHSYLPAVMAISAYAAEYWAVKLFPRATFAVGYGAKRNQFFSVIRLAVLLALAVKLLGDWLVRHL